MTTVRVLLNTEDAAAYLKSTPGTLKAWRYQETGPLFERSGRRVLYDLAELDRWLSGECGRGECRAMTAPPHRAKLASLADVLPPDVWAFARTEALERGITPAAVLRDCVVGELARRILRWGNYGPSIYDLSGSDSDEPA
jgi:hypothetical protein